MASLAHGSAAGAEPAGHKDTLGPRLAALPRPCQLRDRRQRRTRAASARAFGQGSGGHAVEVAWIRLHSQEADGHHRRLMAATVSFVVMPSS